LIFKYFFEKLNEPDNKIHDFFVLVKETLSEEFDKFITCIFKEGKPDILDSPGFSQKVQIASYIRTNLKRILDEGGEQIWTKPANSTYLLKIVPVNEFTEYRSSGGLNYVSCLIKFSPYSAAAIVLDHLTTLFSDRDLAKSLLPILMTPDDSGLTFLDYSFHRRIPQIINLVESVKSEGIVLPKLITVKITYVEKSPEVCAAEEKLVSSYKSSGESAVEIVEGEGRGSSDYLNALTAADKEGLKKEYDYFVSLAKKIGKEYFHFFKTESRATYVYISTVEQLTKAVDEVLLKQRFITVDVEFSSAEVEGSASGKEVYGVHVCSSLQISILGQNFFIDCLELKNEAAEPLRRLLECQKLVKVFHGCESDLDAIYRTYGIVVRNIYDTAKAALSLHNFENMPGLNTLSLQYLGLHLDKSFQKAIWRVRPLPQPMLEYALSDSVVLVPIFYHQITELKNIDVLSKEIWAGSNNIPKVVKPTRRQIVFLD
jgi:hypothetical protein